MSVQKFDDEYSEFLEHYGTPRHSGRYPWGSGKKYQRSRNFLTQYEDLRKKGLSKLEISKALGLKNTSELNAKRAAAREEKEVADLQFVQRLKDKGVSQTEIARRCGKTEGWVRQMLKKADMVVDNENRKKSSIATVANALGEQVREKKLIDIGKANNVYLGITESKFKDSIAYLQQQGYKVIYPKIQQAGTNHKTTMKVLVSPELSIQEAHGLVNTDPTNIKLINEISFKDNGHSGVQKIHDPISIDSKRVKIRYNEEGGIDKDGMIELRRGVKDLDMGEKRFAQVRIMVDGTHYLKGMAVYSDNLPEGTDIMFNTNKHVGTPFEDVLKPAKKGDPHNPYGAEIIRQNDWTDDKGVEHKGALNIVNEEGKWDTWSRNLASQFLSKQPIETAQRQLNLAAEKKEAEYDEIMRISNLTLRKQQLKEFADECDSAAVVLKGAAMPRQSTKVILSLPSIKENEVYAPSYKNGEEVILVRYPHEANFEIPRLIVNNNNKEGKSVITPEGRDAIGINPKTAAQLSGADFDGDTAIVIPTKGQNLVTKKHPIELEGFDPKELYARPKGTESPWKKGSSQEHKQMGMISNLITDMTLQNASVDDIVRATKHSMTIIDTGKHNLDWKESYEQNGIRALEIKYRNGGKGASTLISKAKGEKRVTNRDTNRYNIDPETGEKIFIEKPEFYIKRDKYISKENSKLYESLKKERDKALTDKERNAITKKIGEIPGVKERAEANEKLAALQTKLRAAKDQDEKDSIRAEIKKIPGAEERMMKSTNMYEAKDAMTLSSGHPMETVYANYANRMKALGNKARKEYANTGDIDYNPTAAETYKKEVESLKRKLLESEKNRPLERAAQVIVQSKIQLDKESNPDMTNEEVKKRTNQHLREAREITGAQRYRFDITDREWEAMQTGAVRKTTQQAIFLAADSDKIKAKALPRTNNTLTTAEVSRAKRMMKNGYTLAEVADALDVSVSTLSKNVYE